MKYLWRGASRPSCKELGCVQRSDHPCLNMSARLAKLLRLISEMLPRSCTALARHETTPPPHPPPPPPFLPHPSCSAPPTNPALTGSFLSYLLLLSGFIYIALYSYPDGGYSPSLEKHRDAADSAGRGRGWEWEKQRGDFYYSLSSHDVKQKSRALLSRPCPHIFQPFKTVTKHLAPSTISAAAHDGKPLE